MRVLRVYHGGCNASHRSRERALQSAGVEVVLAVPEKWPEGDSGPIAETFSVRELPVVRSGDVNRHRYLGDGRLRTLIADVGPDVLDLHEEPFSIASRQWLAAARRDLPVVMYTAQNVDKRYPPPFAQYEHAAHRRVAGLYPCSAQAASVARGKGFSGLIEVIPLGFDETVFVPGEQAAEDDELVLGLFGRLVPEKGVGDAVRILARLHASRPTRLVVAGSGPEKRVAQDIARSLGVGDRLEIAPWRAMEDLAATLRSVHIVLIPSRPSETWVEQFGRIIVEAQASGAVVAGYATGAIPEVAGAAGILVDVGDVDRLGERIVGLMSNPGEFARRRDEGLALSSSRTWGHVAERQADLYRRVVAGEFRPSTLPRSPRERRAAARAEFGPTASTSAGVRPFALPVLRRGGRVTDRLGRAIDLAGEAVSKLHWQLS